MDKLDMVYDIVVESRHEIGQFNERLLKIEEDISELKQYKAKLTGICVCISTLIGLVPSVLRHLGF